MMNALVGGLLLAGFVFGIGLWAAYGLHVARKKSKGTSV